MMSHLKSDRNRSSSNRIEGDRTPKTNSGISMASKQDSVQDGSLSPLPAFNRGSAFSWGSSNKSLAGSSRKMSPLLTYSREKTALPPLDSLHDGGSSSDITTLQLQSNSNISDPFVRAPSAELDMRVKDHLQINATCLLSAPQVLPILPAAKKPICPIGGDKRLFLASPLESQHDPLESQRGLLESQNGRNDLPEKCQGVDGLLPDECQEGPLQQEDKPWQPASPGSCECQRSSPVDMELFEEEMGISPPKKVLNAWGEDAPSQEVPPLVNISQGQQIAVSSWPRRTYWLKTQQDSSTVAGSKKIRHTQSDVSDQSTLSSSSNSHDPRLDTTTSRPLVSHELRLDLTRSRSELCDEVSARRSTNRPARINSTEQCPWPNSPPRSSVSSPLLSPSRAWRTISSQFFSGNEDAEDDAPAGEDDQLGLYNGSHSVDYELMLEMTRKVDNQKSSSKFQRLKKKISKRAKQVRVSTPRIGALGRGIGDFAKNR